MTALLRPALSRGDDLRRLLSGEDGVLGTPGRGLQASCSAGGPDGSIECRTDRRGDGQLTLDWS